MTADKIIKIRDRKEKCRIQNEDNYQHSGDACYYRAARRYEELVDICNQALSAADDHTANINIKAELISLASRAADLKYHHANDIPDDIKQFLYTLIRVASYYGFVDKWS